MAKKVKQEIVLGLNFEAESSQIDKISKKIQDMTKIKFDSDQTHRFTQTVQNTVSSVMKSINKELGSLGKDGFASIGDVSKFVDQIKTSISSLNITLGRFKSTTTNKFNSAANQKNLIEVRKYNDELVRMAENYEHLRELEKKRDAIKVGSSEAQRTANNKRLKALSKKDRLTPEEKKDQKKLLAENEAINEKLRERAKIVEQLQHSYSGYGVSSASMYADKMAMVKAEQTEILNNSITDADYKAYLDKLEELIKEDKELISLLNETNPVGVAGERQEALDEAAAMSTTIGRIVKELGIPALTLEGMVTSIKKIVSYSYTYVKNLDSALTEISIVSGKSRAEVQKLTDTFIELSAKTGMAIDDIAQASTIYYQQGLNDKAVKQLTEYTALFAKISGEDVSTAADQITAAMNGFGYAYTNVEQVVDKMSVLAAHSAASIQELATAMSKGASQAAMAGLSFDQYNAYLATMIETTREAPENLGTSLKTIMSRFLEVKKSGTSDDGETDVNRVETALKSVGIQLRDSQNQLRELGDVLNELGPKWKSLDRNTQAYLGTVIAGSRLRIVGAISGLL